ncbi:GNAT family N-acetyltransferase [Marinomonas sp.]
MLIRLARADDAPAVVVLDRQENPYPWGEKLIMNAFESRQGWVVQAPDSGELVAWLCASQLYDQAELELILVAQSVRRQGVARQLMDAWLQALQAQQIAECLLEVRETNTGAMGLYESLGFTQVGHRKNYYKTPKGREAACLYTLSLNEIPQGD